MISDVLYQAVEDIKLYRADFDCYPAKWPEMDKLLRQMDAMRWELDTLPSTPIFLRCLKERALGALSTAARFLYVKSWRALFKLLA